MKRREYDPMIKTVFSAIDTSRMTDHQKQLLKKRVSLNLMRLHPNYQRMRMQTIREVTKQ